MLHVVALSDRQTNEGTEAVTQLIHALREQEKYEVEDIEDALAAQGSSEKCELVPQYPAETVVTEYRRRPQRKLSTEQKAELAAAYQAGATTYELAERFSIHRTTASKIIQKAGHKIRGTGLLSFEITQVVRRYQDGESMKSLARAFKVSKANVKKHLLEQGVTLRDIPYGFRAHS